MIDEALHFLFFIFEFSDVNFSDPRLIVSERKLDEYAFRGEADEISVLDSIGSSYLIAEAMAAFLVKVPA